MAQAEAGGEDLGCSHETLFVPSTHDRVKQVSARLFSSVINGCWQPNGSTSLCSQQSPSHTHVLQLCITIFLQATMPLLEYLLALVAEGDEERLTERGQDRLYHNLSDMLAEIFYLQKYASATVVEHAEAHKRVSST